MFQWAASFAVAGPHRFDTISTARPGRRGATGHPLIGAFAVTYDLAVCAWWPAAIHPFASLRVTAAPPIVVIGTTGDPNTPYAWAARLAGHIASSSVLTWRGTGHTWLLNGAKDTCMRRTVTRYLVDQSAPPHQTRCP